MMFRSTRRTTLRASLAAILSSSRFLLRASVTAVLAHTFRGRGARARESRVPLTAERVQWAIQNGVAYLKSQQIADGSWPNPGYHHQHTAGPTSLIVHALLAAGEPRNSPQVLSALRFLEALSPEQIDGTYSVGLQTMVFAEIDPQKYAPRIAANVSWLERNQIKAGDNNPGWPGSWAHASDKSRRGDNSSTQFALLGLNAAAQAGTPIKPEVWALARKFLVQAQRHDGGWPYYPNVANSTSSASMTCAGISGLIITGHRLFAGQEQLVSDTIRNCGKTKVHPGIQRGLEWITARFTVRENPGSWIVRQWKHYYLYGMERVGRFAGLRYLGDHDWYREGAEELVATQDVLSGKWTGAAIERESILATSFALLFLATGRAPVLINKLRHGPGSDWNQDIDDVRNLVDTISADWKHLLTWQILDPDTVSVEALLQAPIAYFNGHEAPVFSTRAKEVLRDFVEQGGLIVAEACCGDARFDQGFRALIRELFPADEHPLRPLAADHAVWRAHHLLNPDIHTLWGIERGCRTVIIYSPDDLSCFWNQMEAHPSHPLVIKAQRVGQNIVAYATGRELPADKLVIREVKDFRPDFPRRGALYIGKLRHAGDWNVAPLAIPSLTNSLKTLLRMDVVINHKELFPNDPSLIYYPLLYIHGRSAFSYSNEETDLIRKHLEPGGGTLFADAACGSRAFDGAFRRFIAAMFPGNSLVPIPRDDALYSRQVAYDLSHVQYTRAAGGGRDFPQLEGVKLNGRWAVIYSRYDLGCALERHSGADCQGYSYESAVRIAANIVIYATLP